MQVTDNIPQLDDFYHVPESIKSPVLKILSDLELKHNIKIIFAIESGSRAWGLSPPPKWLYPKNQTAFWRH